jgi:hypothetical protein
MQYILAHWRGELSLTKSTLLNGVIAYLALVCAFLGAGQFIQSQAFVYFGLVIFVGWMIWAVVGIVRCAFKINFLNHSTTLRRIAANVAVLCALAAAIAAAQDLFYLFNGSLSGLTGALSRLTGTQLRPLGQELATQLRASGLEGEWEHGGCTATGLRTKIRVDATDTATSSSFMPGKEGRGPTNEIVNFGAVGPNLFRITMEIPNGSNQGRTVAIVYNFDGHELKTVESRDSTGKVIIENGKWNVGPQKGTAVLPSVRCEN